VGIRDFVAAERVPVTGEFSVNPRPAPASRIPLLENEKPGPLSEDEAVSGTVERTAGPFGLIISGERAPRRQNAASPTGFSIESKPPVRTKSAVPRRINFIAIPTACPPEAHAV